MSVYDLIIRNGNVVFPGEVKKADLAIRDGVIVKIDDRLEGNAVQEYEADGQHIFPGMIDVHVHFSEPGRVHWEGFETGSQMMAAGGCTTYFDMPLNGIPSTIDREALLEKGKIGEGKSIIDFGLWGGLVPGNVDELEALAKSGVIGFKAFLSATGNEEFERADDFTLLHGMKKIAELGKVLALHAESDPITQWLKQEKEKEGLFSADDYAATRPVQAEAEAVERAIAYAELTGCPLHFVHISSGLAIEKIEAAKQRGLDVTVETCPHYLLFNQGDLVKKGAVAKCAPPLRASEEQQKLIECLMEGKFDMISSDHSPCPYEMKDPEVHNLFEAWGGISGGQFSLMSMIELAGSYGIPLYKVAEWTASGPAERFGLSSRKGRIMEGLDADLAIVSLDGIHEASETNFFAKHKQSIYLDHTFPCQITATLSRGKMVYRNGEPIVSGQGEWVKVTDSIEVKN
ncbi:cyclic amidohydrolase [Peribacillus simplex]|uniref:Allantoinase n=1 Tax=Peribacillus simplex TaxID=1478 RepID=A0A109MVN1_9BACI|nr:allantoinase [Peribacillus simplex]KWW16491.1 cyclic amidohydrolase [Peribacillus simplex]